MKYKLNIYFCFNSMTVPEIDQEAKDAFVEWLNDSENTRPFIFSNQDKKINIVMKQNISNVAIERVGETV